VNKGGDGSIFRDFVGWPRKFLGFIRADYQFVIFGSFYELDPRLFYFLNTLFMQETSAIICYSRPVFVPSMVDQHVFCGSVKFITLSVFFKSNYLSYAIRDVDESTRTFSSPFQVFQSYGAVHKRRPQSRRERGSVQCENFSDKEGRGSSDADVGTFWCKNLGFF